MSQPCKVLKKRKCEITTNYSASHPAIDIVGENYTLDEVICYSDGIVYQVQKGRSNNKGSIGNESYGNFVQIQHNGYFTLYAHLENDLKLNVGDKVKEGERIASMGDSGNAYGKHLHFEILKNGIKIDPTPYLDKRIDEESPIDPETNLKHKIGENVEYNKIYNSSTSTNPLNPLYTNGVITKIYPNTRNPYLIGENTGFINEDCIIESSREETNNPLKVGDKVKVKPGSKDYNGTYLASFVYDNIYDVIEVQGNRVVIGVGNQVTCAIDINNLEKQK